MSKIPGFDQYSSSDRSLGHPKAARRIWRTQDVEKSEGFSYFCDAVCEAFMELTPYRTSSKTFSATVESVKLTNGGINKVYGSSHSVERTHSQINRADQPCFYLNIQLRSQCVIHQGNNQIALNQGQMALFDGTKPFKIHHPLDDKMAVASLQLPRHAVETAARAYKIDVGKLGGIRVSDHPSLGPLAVATIRTLADRSATMSSIDAQVLFDNLLRLSVAASTSNEEDTAYEKAVLSPPLLVAILEFLDKHLENPQLSISTVSAHFGVTPRYVHKLFEHMGPSYSQFVRERRLDRIMIILRNPENARTTIADIAFSNGFSDLSSFNRRFKERFGSSPKEIRRG